MREKALGSRQEHVDVSVVDKVVDKEEKEMVEELEKLFLKNICSEIMDEVMDTRSGNDVILPEGFKLERSSKRGKKHKRKNK
jgi:hypothetical protein